MNGEADNKITVSTARKPFMPDPALRKKLKTALIITLCVIAAVTAVYFTAVGIYKAKLEKKYPKSVVNYKKNTVCERFNVPDGFSRVQYAEGSYQDDIQNLKLKKFGLGVYTSEGKRVFDAPLWGVIDGAASAETREKYGFGKSLLLPDIAHVGDAVGANDVYPGCFCGSMTFNIDSQEFVYSGTVLDVCRSEDGKTLVIIAASGIDREAYVLTAPGDPGTVWIDPSEVGLLFNAPSGEESGFYEYRQ